MSSWVEPRGEESAFPSRRLTAGVRPPWVAAGVALLVLDLICLVPANPILAEARHASAWVMILGVLLVAAGEVIDITSEVPAGLDRLYRADVEEPLELAGATLLGAGMLLKCCRDHGIGSDVG